MRKMRQILWTVAGVAGVALLAAPPPASADIVHNDDVIITFSLCVGNDCVNGESFGFDTIRLKENNTRIKFDDTSTTASFPRNDWQITANDSANGGASKFSIDDITNGRTPFTIEATAPSNSLFVDDGGRIGFGTSTPVVELHVKDGDTPTLRLEQDGSSGFTPQTWDVAGNEANFFVRDATNGSALPFKIFPGAGTNSLTVGADEEIGIGTASPTAALHVRRTNGSAQILIEDTSTGSHDLLHLVNAGNTIVQLEDSAESKIWELQTFKGGNCPVGETCFLASLDGSGGQEMLLDESGDVTFRGAVFSSGPTCAGASGCDAVFQPDYPLPSITDHAASMWTNSHLPAVGPTSDEVPMNLSQKTAGILNELEKAHIYIEQLHQRLLDLEAKVAEK